MSADIFLERKRRKVENNKKLMLFYALPFAAFGESAKQQLLTKPKLGQITFFLQFNIRRLFMKILIMALLLVSLSFGRTIDRTNIVSVSARDSSTAMRLAETEVLRQVSENNESLIISTTRLEIRNDRSDFSASQIAREIFPIRIRSINVIERNRGNFVVSVSTSTDTTNFTENMTRITNEEIARREKVERENNRLNEELRRVDDIVTVRTTARLEFQRQQEERVTQQLANRDTITCLAEQWNLQLSIDGAAIRRESPNLRDSLYTLYYAEFSELINSNKKSKFRIFKRYRLNFLSRFVDIEFRNGNVIDRHGRVVRPATHEDIHEIVRLEVSREIEHRLRMKRLQRW